MTANSGKFPRPENAQEGHAGSGPQTMQLSSHLIKNLRLSKHNIKAHVSKRYGKTISERFMAILESFNKTMHNIEYNAYLELIFYSFFSL